MIIEGFRNDYNYFDFADNDYQYFMEDCERGRVANYMASQAQSICERYLKHLIEVYVCPQDGDSNRRKRDVLTSHSLNKLINYLSEYTDFSFSQMTLLQVRAIDGYYFSTRYPGTESFFVNENDINLCKNATEACRKEILEYIENKEKDIQKE